MIISGDRDQGQKILKILKIPLTNKNLHLKNYKNFHRQGPGTENFKKLNILLKNKNILLKYYDDYRR
jgi:hypothetical protein